MKKKALFIVVALLMVAVFSVPASAETVLRLGHITDTGDVWHLASEVFAEEVYERTDGEVRVEIFPNEQLGNEMEMIEGIRTNTIADMTITGESLGNWAEKIEILGAMYLFRDSEHIEAVADGEIGEEIEQNMLEEANIRALTWFERGPRHLTSNEPIETPEDVQGFQMRVPNVPWFLAGWSEIGADPAPMAFGEVYSALQQGVIDGQENPLALIESANFYEVQDYVNLTGHIKQWIYLAIGEDQFQSLTEEQQEAVLEASDVAHEYHQELFYETEEKLRDTLEEKGMTFVEVDEEAFREAAESVVYDEFPEFIDLFERIQEVGQ